MFSRTDKSFLGRWWWTVDRPMLAAFIVLALCGIILIATASPPVAEHLNIDHYHFLKRHLMFLAPALALLIGVSMLEPRQIWRMASILFTLSALAMIFAVFSAVEIKGARRWISVFGFSLQPSEFIKPAFIIIAAWLMALQKSRESFPGNAITAGLYFLVISLLLLQPDLGMTFVVTCCWATQIFLAGFPFRLLIAFALTGVLGLVLSYFSFDHVHRRVDAFLNPDASDNFQVEKSLEAFRAGGILGAGPGQGSVKLHLPDAHADFIFAVAGEEMGLIFIIALMIVFGFIMVRGFNRLMASEEMFPVLAAGGLLAMFGLQAIINMGSSLNVLPAKGMTLPFISYGGSSLLSVGLAMGSVLAFTRRQTGKKTGNAASLSLRPYSAKKSS
jgi:cell division protein FtsW